MFGQEFAKVDVLPATDRIYIFRYGAEEKNVVVSPNVTERYLPVAFLKDFNVVDTPGTNTIVTEHQTITENFVPRADLVLFVFSVANPWTQSAWDFLKFVQKKWLKNVVFVLQQADLREPSEIEVIRRHLQDTAMQKLGIAPPIFAVSARKALLARTQSPKASSGARRLAARRANQSDRVGVVDAHGQVAFGASDRAPDARRNHEEIRASFDVITRDEARLAGVDQFVQARKEQTLRQVSGLVRGVEHACRSCAAQGREMLEQEFSFWRTWKMIWSRQRSQREFQTQLEMKLRQTIEPQMEHAVQLLEADLRGLWPQVQDLLEARLGGDLRHQLPRTPPDFARQRRELLQSVRLALVEHVAGKSIEEHLAKLFAETSARLRLPAGVAAVGGIATVIAAMMSAAVADVTGVLAASAAIAGAYVALTQRKKILRTYEAQMDAKCAELLQAVEEQLKRAIDVFYKEIVVAFEPLAAFCVAQRRIYQPLLERAEELQARFDGLGSRLGSAGAEQ